MEGLRESINIDKLWYQNTIAEEQKCNGAIDFTAFAARYYQQLHPLSKMYIDPCTFGSYTYLPVAFVYKPEIQNYYLFEYCQDSIQDIGSMNSESILHEIQLVMDRRTEFDAKKLLEYLWKQVGAQYTFGFACWTAPDFAKECKEKEKVSLQKFVKWMAEIEIWDVVDYAKTLSEIKTTYVADDFYQDKDFNDTVSCWKQRKYSESILGHPIWLAMQKGNWSCIDRLLHTGMEYMTLDIPYIDNNIIFFGVDMLGNEQLENEAWKFMMDHNVKYDTVILNENLLESDHLEMNALFNNSEIKWWVKEFLRLDNENDKPQILTDHDGSCYYRDILDEILRLEGKNVDQLRKMSSYIYRLFEARRFLEMAKHIKEAIDFSDETIDIIQFLKDHDNSDNIINTENINSINISQK